MKNKRKKLKALYLVWKENALNEEGKDKTLRILFQELGFKEKDQRSEKWR